MSEPRGQPRIVVSFIGAHNDLTIYRIVHTGARYELQEEDSSESAGWRVIGPVDGAFDTLASLLDPDDEPGYNMVPRGQLEGAR